MAKYYLIRHGMTYGNTLKRYIGTTNETLCEEGIIQLTKNTYPKVQQIFVSPMLRCIQTANIIYKEHDEYQIVDDLRECNFGAFENKNYKELEGNVLYQAWIDSNANLPFPGGESVKEFKARCLRAFHSIEWYVSNRNLDTVAIIAHGGTFMSILEEYGIPKKGYYEWILKHGECVELIR